MTSSTTFDDLPIPDRPDLPGLRFRHWRGLDDLVGMGASNQLARDDAGAEDVVNVEAMTRYYSHLEHCDLDRDLVVVERDGRTIGYVRVDWADLTNGERQFFSFCVLEPAERGQGIGQAMLSWSEERLAEIVAVIPADRTGRLFAYTSSTDVHATRLMERNGWSAIAKGYEMVRATLDDIPDRPLPSGLLVREVAESERRVIWEAARDAFRDHRDEQEWTEDQWTRFIEDVPDRSLWTIAFDGDAVAGGIWGNIDAAANAHHGRERGVLGSVWTGANWRRRGLAKALIARNLLLLRERGMTSAYLGVDGANPNQALDLYEAMGFKVATSTIDWRKPLSSPRIREAS